MPAFKYLANNAGVTTEIQAKDASAGAGDAGKAVALNASGLIDPTMLPVAADRGAFAALVGAFAGAFTGALLAVLDGALAFDCTFGAGLPAAFCVFAAAADLARDAAGAAGVACLDAADVLPLGAAVPVVDFARAAGTSLASFGAAGAVFGAVGVGAGVVGDTDLALPAGLAAPAAVVVPSAVAATAGEGADAAALAAADAVLAAATLAAAAFTAATAALVAVDADGAGKVVATLLVPAVDLALVRVTLVLRGGRRRGSAAAAAAASAIARRLSTGCESSRRGFWMADSTAASMSLARRVRTETMSTSGLLLETPGSEGNAGSRNTRSSRIWSPLSEA